MITTPELAAQARRHAATLTPTERADLLYGLVDAIYNAVKYDNPEGGGLDGRDGPERTSLATVVDAAQDHQHATYARVSATAAARDAGAGTDCPDLGESR